MRNNYVKVITASTNGIVNHNAKPTTTDRINQLRKELGINPKEATFAFNVRKDFRLLNNPNLN